MKDAGICPVADIVINHRCAEAQDDQGRWNLYTGRMNWDQKAITTDNPQFGGRGNHGTGEDYGPAPNIDHTQV
jgi:alpha-amylase